MMRYDLAERPRSPMRRNTVLSGEIAPARWRVFTIQRARLPLFCEPVLSSLNGETAFRSPGMCQRPMETGRVWGQHLRLIHEDVFLIGFAGVLLTER